MSSTGRIKQYPVVSPRIDSAVFTNTVVETTGANFVHIRGNIIFEVEDLDTNFIQFWNYLMSHKTLIITLFHLYQSIFHPFDLLIVSFS